MGLGISLTTGHGKTLTKVLLFTPTYRPGFDVSIASVDRQTLEPDIWYIGDSYFLRDENFHMFLKNLFEPQIEVWISDRQEPIEHNVRELCRAYNFAAELAIEQECDLLISMQDYIWIPEDGIQKFVDLHEKHPNFLLTGLTDISSDPYPVRIKDQKNSYTIFDKPYSERPKLIAWEDSRDVDIYVMSDAPVLPILAQHWEANWAAVPVKALKEGLRWDEDYDEGIAYENMDFAQRAVERGYGVLMDRTNRSISLPHKRYWPKEEELIEKHSNRTRYEARWMN